MKYSQKGAMFGLDARIALAIFGALSVITGAALYSAIQDSKVVSIITEMDNIDKAVTAYYLDTGVYPTESAADAALLDTGELTSSSVTGWLGPYLTFPDGTAANTLGHSSYGDISIYRAFDADWDDVTAAGSKCLSTDVTGPCSVFICYSDIPDDIAKAIDIKVDGSEGADTGNFRWVTGGNACKKGLIYDKDLAPAS